MFFGVIRNADKFLIKKLKIILEKRLIRNINASDVINYLNKAIVCSAELLKFWAVKFILFNVESILETKQWIKFVQKNPEFISEIIKNGNDNGNTIPGAQIQFSSVGLNYMAGVAIDYINSAIAKVNIPDIKGFLKFTYHLSQIKIEEFNIPKSSNVFQFSSLDKLGINLQGISGKMSTYYQLHGSLPDDMNDLFRKEIEKHFKENIEVICQVIEKVESDQDNKILGSFPLDIRLTGTFKGFHIDYPLTSNPESSTISFTISIEGFIYY
uniref:Lipid-binding serum glycoprotein N-terminal domain-containing protein n=1 Tax=Strongyloides venezuelensis TaxID=75913 RepID=A0A0K0FRK7_STRVS